MVTEASTFWFIGSMARGKSKFNQSDVCRAVRAARASGLKVRGIEITSDGRIVVAVETGPSEIVQQDNEWDSVK
jgi:hypothetical protein